MNLPKVLRLRGIELFQTRARHSRVVDTRWDICPGTYSGRLWTGLARGPGLRFPFLGYASPLWKTKQLTRLQIEDVTTNANIIEAPQNDEYDTLAIPQDGYHLVHLKPDTEFTKKNRRSLVVLQHGLFNAGEKVLLRPAQIARMVKGVFVDCRTFKGLFDEACGNFKKRDDSARCSHSNAFQESRGRTREGIQKASTQDYQDCAESSQRGNLSHGRVGHSDSFNIRTTNCRAMGFIGGGYNNLHV